MSKPGTDQTLLDPGELRELMARDENVVIVDVQSGEEFSAGHIDGAINIPIATLEDGIRDLSKDARVVTVCTLGGARS